MAKQNNTQVLLNEIIAQELSESVDFTKESDFFEFYVSTQRMKEHELSDEEVMNGIIGGGNDGGCDSIYIFVNNTLVTEEFAETFKPMNDVSITMYIIQAKKSPSFSEDAIMKWKTVSENLFELDNDKVEFKGRYHDGVLTAFNTFKTLMLKLVRHKPTVLISYSYISLASELHPNVELQAQELKETVKRFFPNKLTTVEVNFIGAEKLMEMIHASTKSDYLLSLIENPITIGQQKDYVALISLSNYYNFIKDEKGNLRSNIFEANVRDFQGNNSVNKGIRETLRSNSDENFWWLNNGITMLASDVHQPSGKEILVTNPEVVNGLQTSNEIYNYFVSNENLLTLDERSVLVRIIVPKDESSRDRIILATNNQTNIPKSTLRVTDPIHRDIEMYLKPRGLFYDRRKNYYKNQGKKAYEIISVSFLAQCLITLLLQQPDQARARPSTILTNDDAYKELYEEKYSLDLYFNCAALGKKVDRMVKSLGELLPSTKSDILFYVLYVVVAKMLGTNTINASQLRDLSLDDFTDEKIIEAINITLETYNSLGGTGQVAKSKDLIVALNEELFPNSSEIK